MQIISLLFKPDISEDGVSVEASEVVDPMEKAEEEEEEEEVNSDLI